MDLKVLKNRVLNKITKTIITNRIDLGYDKNLRELKYNYKFYCYLKKKYKKDINQLKMIPKGKHEYSNKVWWCWLQGEQNAPELCKACLHSLRKHLPDREIIVITEDNYKEYITFPEHIENKFRKGIISRTHFSDLIRLALLIKYGGTWIDSSVYLTSYNPAFFDKDLFVFQSVMRNDSSMNISNWFITSEINNPILIATQQLLYSYWKKENRVKHYFVFHIFFKIVSEIFIDEFKNMSIYSNVPCHLLQFELNDEFNNERYNELIEMSSVHKLSQKIVNSKEKDNFYSYIIKRYKDEL